MRELFESCRTILAASLLLIIATGAFVSGSLALSILGG